jgi:hypothetical protein
MQRSKMTLRSESERRIDRDCLTIKVFGEERLSEWSCRSVIFRNEEQLSELSWYSVLASSRV